jgi:hypothetical protein
VAYLSQRLRLRKLFVNFLGEVLVGLEDLAVRHAGGWGCGKLDTTSENKIICASCGPQTVVELGGLMMGDRKLMELSVLRLDV